MMIAKVDPPGIIIANVSNREILEIKAFSYTLFVEMWLKTIKPHLHLFILMFECN